MKALSKIKKNKYFLHKTKRKVVIKFALLLLILIAYFVFLSFKYGIKDGLSATILTWSFFVFCTPIADAGFLLDFPIRLITKIRMIYSEMVVWTLAFLINLYSIFLNPGVYEKTGLLKIFKHILQNPYPFWSIILLSAFGTYLSIYFGDELIDVVKNRNRKKFIKHGMKHKIVIAGFVLLICGIIATYYYLLEHLGIKI